MELTEPQDLLVQPGLTAQSEQPEQLDLRAQPVLTGTVPGPTGATGATGAAGENEDRGNDNTASGSGALNPATTGTDNTAIGFSALTSNTTGIGNSAHGSQALSSNTTGNGNTAIGKTALLSNTTGDENTATGLQALLNNTTGGLNAAAGFGALQSNTTGGFNTANGTQALFNNTSGANNTANGFVALAGNTTGNQNTADGWQALRNNTSGNFNIAIGVGAGFNLTTGDSNIDIGNYSTTAGHSSDVAGEANTIRIGYPGLQTATYVAGINNAAVTGAAVLVDATTGQLGIATSSARFKDAIEPMGNASDALLSLRPVTFHYKKNIDPNSTPQFGLVAEEVEKIDPALITRDADGKPFTVRYDAVNAMLLNEFLKEHKKVEELEATVAQLKATAAQQQKDFNARLKDLDNKIQTVSDKVELTKPAPRTVDNNQ